MGVDLSDPARAREIREQRVDHIVGLMSRGQWRAAASHRELSREWDISIGAVQDYAREASGIIRHLVSDDADNVRAQIIACVEQIRYDALNATKSTIGGDEYNAPDLNAALKAVELHAKLLGLITQKVDAKVSDTNPLSARDYLARIEAALPELRRRAAEEAGGE